MYFSCCTYSLTIVLKKEKKKKPKVHREKASNGLSLQEPKPAKSMSWILNCNWLSPLLLPPLSLAMIPSSLLQGMALGGSGSPYASQHSLLRAQQPSPYMHKPSTPKRGKEIDSACPWVPLSIVLPHDLPSPLIPNAKSIVSPPTSLLDAQTATHTITK